MPPTHQAALLRQQSKTQLSVIIPTRNEPLIQVLVDQVHRAFSFVDHEIIVVDKSDRLPILKDARVIRQHSTGLGRAIVEGIAMAQGKWVAVMDGDFSHQPRDLASMFAGIGHRDFVLGSRYASGGSNLDIPVRRLASRAFNMIARLILGLKFSDPMSGLVLARTTVFQRVHPNPIGFKINLELIFRATRLGFRGGEVPITFVARSSGRSKAGVRGAVRTLSYILALRLRR